MWKSLFQLRSYPDNEMRFPGFGIHSQQECGPSRLEA